jgi:hypothetical protein
MLPGECLCVPCLHGCSDPRCEMSLPHGNYGMTALASGVLDGDFNTRCSMAALGRVEWVHPHLAEVAFHRIASSLSSEVDVVSLVQRIVATNF